MVNFCDSFSLEKPQIALTLIIFFHLKMFKDLVANQKYLTDSILKSPLFVHQILTAVFEASLRHSLSATCLGSAPTSRSTWKIEDIIFFSQLVLGLSSKEKGFQWWLQLILLLRLGEFWLCDQNVGAVQYHQTISAFETPSTVYLVMAFPGT